MYIYIYIYIEFSTVVLKFQTDLAKAPCANDEPLTCLERAWRAPPTPCKGYIVAYLSIGCFGMALC